jgi:hypothetical protein
MTIPKIIHQLWIQGESEVPNNLNANRIKIQKLHKNWKYVFWDEASIIALLQTTNIEWFHTYNKFIYLHQKVDYAKLIILCVYGGIFIDMDAYTIKPLDSLFEKYGNYDFIISYLKEINAIANFMVCRRLGKCLNNGIFIGKPNSDILYYMISKISYDCSILQPKISCISNTTGPVFFDKNIFNYINSSNNHKSKIKILDNEYLEPCISTVCDVTDNTYIKHEHNLSWVNEPMKILFKLYFHNTLLIHFLFLFVFILYLIISYTNNEKSYIKLLRNKIRNYTSP